LAWGERTHFGEQLGEGYAVVSFFGIGGNATTDVNLKFSEIAHRYNVHDELAGTLGLVYDEWLSIGEITKTTLEKIEMVLREAKTMPK
jgi:hypothetical protein